MENRSKMRSVLSSFKPRKEAQQKSDVMVEQSETNEKLLTNNPAATENNLKKETDNRTQIQILQDILMPDGICHLPSEPVNLVFEESIFLSEGDFAMNKEKLKQYGISVVVNCAQGNSRCHVRTDESYYGKDFSFLGLQADDTVDYDLSIHFNEVAEFLEDTFKQSPDAKVLVHCKEGVSRCSTITTAYLMKKRGFTLAKALELLSSKRSVCPSDHFLQLLIQYEEDLLESKLADQAQIQKLQEILMPDGICHLPTDPANLVFEESIYLAEGDFAMNKEKLKQHGISVVVNCAQGNSRCHVRTDESYYGKDFSFLGLKADDTVDYDLSVHFDQVADFLEDTFKENPDAKVLVHCKEGVSRCSTITTAYLMKKRGFTLAKALIVLRSKRSICPNDNFLMLLVRYEKLIRKLDLEDHQAQLEALHDILMPNGVCLFPSDPVNLVFEESIYLAEGNFAMDKEKIKQQGISVVVNCAQGKSNFHVDTDQSYYGDDITFLGIAADDSIDYDLSVHFDPVANFLENVFNQNPDVKVLVHCKEGVSRCSAITTAYLIKKRGFNLPDALETLRSKRNICPNDRFLSLLMQYAKDVS